MAYLQWHVLKPGTPGTPQNTPEHSGTPRNTVEQPRTLWNTPEHPGTLWNTPEHSGTTPEQKVTGLAQILLVTKSILA